MMSTKLEHLTSRPEVASGLAQRALVDFDLLEAFEIRPAQDQMAAMHWIAVTDGPEEEERVSRLLDALWVGDPLPGAGG